MNEALDKQTLSQKLHATNRVLWLLFKMANDNRIKVCYNINSVGMALKAFFSLKAEYGTEVVYHTWFAPFISREYFDNEISEMSTIS